MPQYDLVSMNEYHYVTMANAMKIIGAKTPDDLESLGCLTLQSGDDPPLWSVDDLIETSRSLQRSRKFHPDYEWISSYVESLKERHRRKIAENNAADS